MLLRESVGITGQPITDGLTLDDEASQRHRDQTTLTTSVIENETDKSLCNEEPVGSAQIFRKFQCEKRSENYVEFEEEEVGARSANYVLFDDHTLESNVELHVRKLKMKFREKHDEVKASHHRSRAGPACGCALCSLCLCATCVKEDEFASTNDVLGKLNEPRGRLDNAEASKFLLPPDHDEEAYQRHRSASGKMAPPCPCSMCSPCRCVKCCPTPPVLASIQDVFPDARATLADVALRSVRYPWVDQAFGVSINGGVCRDDQDDGDVGMTASEIKCWDELCSEPTAFAKLALTRGLCGFDEMDSWLERHKEFVTADIRPGSIEATVLQDKLRATRLEQLDKYIPMRDNVRASKDFQARQNGMAAITKSAFVLKRASRVSEYARLARETNQDAAMELAAVLAADSKTVYAYNEVAGLDVNRDFQDTEMRALPHRYLRHLPNCVPIRVARSDGRLYTDSDVSLARKTFSEDFTTLEQMLQSAHIDTGVLPEMALGTWDNFNGLFRSAPVVFSMLMHRLERLFVSATNKHEKVVLQVNGGAYHRFGSTSNSAFNKTTAGLPTPTARLLDTLQHGSQRKQWDDDVNNLDARLDIVDVRCLFLKDEFSRRESPADARRSSGLSYSDTRNAYDLTTIRRQHSTFLAPLHPDGLSKYQAGPLFKLPVNGVETTVMADSGFTSDMRSNYILVQPAYLTRLNIPIDESKKHRVTLADGSATNTLGTAKIVMQFPFGDRHVDARVLAMESADVFDVLIGWQFMLNNNLTLFNDTTVTTGPAHGVRMPGGQVLPYCADWDSQASEVQAYRMYCSEQGLSRDETTIRRGAGSDGESHGNAENPQTKTVTFDMDERLPSEDGPLKTSTVQEEMQQRTLDRMKLKAEFELLREQVQKEFVSVMESPDDEPDEPGEGRHPFGDHEEGGKTSLRRSFITGYDDGYVWKVPKELATQTGIEDIEFRGTSDGPEEMSDEMEELLKEKEAGRFDGELIYYEDVPDVSRLEMSMEQRPVQEHVLAAMEAELELQPHLRLVTNLCKRRKVGQAGEKMTSLGFLRKVSTLLPHADRLARGEWCMTVAPPEVVRALSEECHERVMVKLTGKDGKETEEEWDIEDLKADLVDHEKGRVLGEGRRIFDEDNPGRIVKTETPFDAELKDEYNPAMNPQAKPFYEYRRVAPSLRPVVTAWILDAVEKGIISPYQSAYASPLFLVKKPMKLPGDPDYEKSGGANQIQKWRTILDLRACNRSLKPVRYPQTSTQEVFESISPSFKIFSGVDLKSAFFQIGCSERVKKYLTFMSHPVVIPEDISIPMTDGTRNEVKAQTATQFCFNRLPQGLLHSPSTFAAALRKTLQEGCPQYFDVNIFQFADDILIASVDHQQHYEILHSMFRALDAGGWTLARNKSHLFQRSMQFLGLVISSAGVDEDGNTGMCQLYGDAAKVQVILDLPKPQDLTSLRSFLGCANFMRCFVKNFSLIAAPLVKLTKKGADVKAGWGAEQDEAFAELKLAIATAGAITAYDPQKALVIQCDACRLGCAAMLAQEYGDKLRPVAFMSRVYREDGYAWRGKGSDVPEPVEEGGKKRKARRKGSSHPPQMLELRAIVESVLTWRRYIQGNVIGISILSDHGSLRFIDSQRSQGLCSPQVERWANFLSSLQAKVSWKAGAGLTVSDYLSRNAKGMEDPSELGWSEREWTSKYSDREDGMKPVSEMLKDVSFNSNDFGAACDEEIDSALIGSADELLCGVPIREVIPLSCPEDQIKFKGPPIGEFLRLSQQCVDQTGVEDIHSRVFEAHALVRDQSILRAGNGEGVEVAVNPNRLGDATFSKPTVRFKNLWEPAQLSVLRDDMQYQGAERLIQLAFVEGWSSERTRKEGIATSMSGYAINSRHELQVYDSSYGWSTVIPAQSEYIFRKVVRWLHECNHSSEAQQYRQIRRRFFWNSPELMKRVIHSVHVECSVCVSRKRSTSKPGYISSPITVGHRPFEVIAVDPVPKPVDPVSGHDSILLCTDRFTGYTLGIPHYTTDDADTLAKLLVRHVYSLFGVPKLFLSDHDPKFASELFNKVHKEIGCSVELGTPYHYRTSGAVEVKAKTLGDELNILSAKFGDQGLGWYENLPRALYNLNQKENRETGLSPASLLFGYRPISPVDTLSDPVDENGDVEFATRVETFMQSRDDDRHQHADRRRQMRERQELASRVDAANVPNYIVGAWVLLHKAAFGSHSAKRNKLVSRESYGPYRITAVDMKRGRITVDFNGEFTRGKCDEFSMQHVRRYYLQRPWTFDAVTLEQRIAVDNDADEEHEVDQVHQRRFLHGSYKYQVSFKGWDQLSKNRVKDHPEFEGCQKLLEEFDAQYPIGSLKGDSPPDQRKWKQHVDAHPRRKSARLRRQRALNFARELKASAKLTTFWRQDACRFFQQTHLGVPFG